MRKQPQTNSPWRDWSALVPIGMSLIGLAMVLLFAAFGRVEPHADEGAPARIFQLLMTLQLPVVVFFIIKWLPRAPRKAVLVLVLQGLAWIAAVGAIYLIERV